MPEFELIECEELECDRIRIFKLVKDQECFYDLFENEIEQEGTYGNELIKLSSIMISYSEGVKLPDTKLNPIEDKRLNPKMKGFEIKTHNLRVYMVFLKGVGAIIIHCGKKGSQKKDISKFCNLANEYFETIE